MKIIDSFHRVSRVENCTIDPYNYIYFDAENPYPPAAYRAAPPLVPYKGTDTYTGFYLDHCLERDGRT